ncbi:LysR family transcriptional regulator [Marinobacterium jannaschii]|uniref:LysR family transcriptional regulator n=1 Tax=Marinobacterium jannaschii TaxID=64970 RepID=UPI0004814030|nr:LysR family transcriptional regulator [Marinobacterium jannaschii]
MNLTYIDTFLDVAASRNFNRSAESLCITQSAVSTRIKALEESLGVTLFSRGRFGAELTRDGVRFQQYASKISETWREAKQDLTLPRGYTGVLRLSTQFSIWERLVNRWLLWLRENQPELALHIEADYSMTMMEQILGRVIDIGIMYQPRALLDIEVCKLFDDCFVLISTEPQTLAGMDLDRYVYIDWCPGFRHQHSLTVPQLQARGVTMGLGTMAIEYLKRQGGSVYLPAWRTPELLASGEFYAVAGAPVITQPVFAVYRQEIARESWLADALDSLMEISARTERELHQLVGLSGGKVETLTV